MTRTSPALFLQMMLCVGHQLVIALNSRLRSSFLASSSAGDMWLDSRTNTCKIICYGWDIANMLGHREYVMVGTLRICYGWDIENML